MKRLGTAWILATVSAWAQQPMGTKPDVVSFRPSTDIGLGGVVQMLLALVVVGFLVRYLLPRWLPALANKRRIGAMFGEIEIIESKSIGPATLHVVETRGRTLLIATTAAGASLVADLSPRDTVGASLTFESALRAATPRGPADGNDGAERFRAVVSDAATRLGRLSEGA